MKIIHATIIGVGIVSIIVVILGIQNQNLEDQNKVRVAFFPNVGHAVPIIGEEKEFFKNSLGEETKIEILLFDSGPQIIEAMIANSIDLAYVGPGPAINGFLKSDNNDVRILAGAASGGASFVVHPKSSIQTVEDFPGKRIASPLIGNSQDLSLRNFLMENNLKPAEKGGSIVILNIANPEIYTLFVKGDIDAAWVPEPWATIFVHQLGGIRLFYEEDLWPEKQFASVLLVGRVNFIEKNPQLVQNWIETNNSIVEWINKNPNDTQVILNNYLKKHLGKPIPEDILKESLENIEFTNDPIPNSIEEFAKRADTLGYLGRSGYSLNGIFYNSTGGINN